MSIVVGYIPTPEGRAALGRAVDEAKLRRTNLVVVNSRDSMKQATAQEKEQHERELDELAGELKSAGVEHEIRQMDRGTLPSEDLIEVGAEINADFIVIGLRRRSPVGKLFLGSNAQEILLNAECAVLSVRAEK